MPQYGIANRANPSLSTSNVPPEMQQWTKEMEQWAKGLPLQSIECEVSKVAAWNTIAGAGWVKVVFDHVLTDTGNFVGDLSATVTTDTITIPPQAGGHYIMSALLFDDAAAHGVFYTSIWVTDLTGASRAICPQYWTGLYQSISGHQYLKPGETVSLQYYNGSGVAVSIPVDVPWQLHIARVAL